MFYSNDNKSVCITNKIQFMEQIDNHIAKSLKYAKQKKKVENKFSL